MCETTDTSRLTRIHRATNNVDFGFVADISRDTDVTACIGPVDIDDTRCDWIVGDVDELDVGRAGVQYYDDVM